MKYQKHFLTWSWFLVVWLNLLVNLSSAATFTESDFCQQPHHLPLMTHYSEGSGFVLGASGNLSRDIHNLEAEAEYREGRPHVRVYNHSFVPKANSYIAMNYDLQPFDDQLVKDHFLSVCKETGVAYRLLQPGIVVKDRAQVATILSRGQAYAQVVHSLVFRNNLFTVILPPAWGASPQSKKYPLLINGFYDLNGNLLGAEGPRLMKVIARLYQQNKFGAVGILWNGGGAMASRTVNDQAYKDLNDFLKIMVPVLGIQKDQVVALGGSRGGVTALNIASHPAITAIRVRFVYAANPPSAFDQIFSVFGATFPSLLAASDWSTGWAGSYLPSFVYPEGFPGYSGLSGNLAHLKVLTGTTDWRKIQNNFNLTSPAKMQRLKQRKTEVFLELGTHDNICPYYDKSLLFQKYNQARIPTETRVVYLKGHRPDGSWRDQRVFEVMQTISNEILRGQKRKKLVRAGVVDSYLIPAHQSKAVPMPEWSAERPLVLEVPRYFSDELTGAIVAVGMPGRRYQLIFEGPENFRKVIDLHLNRWGQAKQTVIPSEFPVGSTTLVRIWAMDEHGQPERVIKTLKSSLPMEEPLVMTRWVGSVRSLGLQIPELLLNGFLGPNKEFQITDGEGPIGGTHGVVEIPEDFQ